MSPTLTIRRMAVLVLLMLPFALGPPALAQHGGGHHGGGGHHSFGGHSGYSGHYGGYYGHGYSGHHYSPYSGHYYSGGHYFPSYSHGYYGPRYSPYYGHHWYGHYPYHFGFYYGPSYRYYGSSALSYGPTYGRQVYTYYAPDSATQVTTDQATSAGLDYQRRAEAAFRARDFDQAVRWANHAAVEMPRHGKHFQLLSQALFAVGDYRGAAATAQQGMALSEPKDWGEVIKNFRLYYTDKDYTEQMKRLEEFAKDEPDAAYARFLLGYHHGFLGHVAEARRQLEKAVELESRDQWARRLLELFGG